MPTFQDLKKKLTIEKNSNVPQKSCSLPSNGAKALIIPMKVRDHKDLLKALQKSDEYLINEAFDTILQNSVIKVDDKPFDVDDLCQQDRGFLLLEVRKLTAGPIAKISHECPISHKVISDIEIDLDTLKVDYYKGDSIIREIKVSENVKFVYGPFTRKDEKAMEKWMKTQGKDFSFLDRKYGIYAGLIRQGFLMNEETKEWEEVPMDFLQKLEFVNNSFTQDDIKTIDTYIKEELDFGVRIRFPFKSDVYQNDEEEGDVVSFFIM